MLESSFFCEKCREKVSSIDQLFFVEDQSDRGFCSEDCIKTFYKPFMRLMEEEEILFRSRLNLDEEDESLAFLSREELIDSGIHLPDEVWLMSNEIGQNFYTHLKKFSDKGKEYFLILICAYIDESPSFVFYRTISSHNLLVDQYRRSSEIEVERELPVRPLGIDDIPAEIIENLDLKKSSFLAELLNLRSESDIGFELFMDYDKFLKETMETPDEVYLFEDEEGDEIYTFIKSFIEDEHTFFYIALAQAYQADDRADKKPENLMLPILSFPSRDHHLYPEYARGHKVRGKLKN